jgi:hypothetical protein
MYFLRASFVGASDPTVAYSYVVSQFVGTTKIITVQCKDLGGAAVDPVSGTEMNLEIVLKTSTAP